MIGIISYKDLEDWDCIMQKDDQNQYNSPHRECTDSDFYESGRQYRSLHPGEPANSYRGCYIILLGNIYNETPALKLILDNYEYLNERTVNVRFFMPGFVINKDGINLCQPDAVSHKDKFMFNTNGFFETVQWLERSNLNYQYSESMDMILLPYIKGRNGCKYYFDHMLYYNLDELHKSGKNILQFITRAIPVVQRQMTFEGAKIQMEGISNGLSENTHKTFIAGSKTLERERDSIRAVLSQLSNRGEKLYQAWTFEDFDRSFSQDGRQSDYNTFIRDDADSVVFILSDKVGGITLDEFEVAIKTFRQNNRPRIYVYCHTTDKENTNEDIKKIKEEIGKQNQYYTDYTDISDLKHQVMRDFGGF